MFRHNYILYMKYLLKILRYTTLGFFALIVVFVVVNQFDEKLDPELRAILDKPYPAPSDEQNAFYAYVGFYAPEGDDIAEAGKRVLERYQKTTSSGKSQDFSASEVLGAKAIEPKDDGMPVCREARQRSFCLVNIRGTLAKTQSTIEKNQVLIDRYYSLYKYKHFQSNSSYLPTTPFTVHKYVLSDIAIKWIKGARREAIGLLIDDIHFHRMLGRETRLLLHKMIASAGLNHAYGLLHDFINECHTCVLEDARIHSVLSSLDGEMLLSQRVMEGEIRWAYTTTMETLASSPSRYDFFRQAMRWETGGKPGSIWHGFFGYLTLVNATINQGFKKLQFPNLVLSHYKFREFEKQLTHIESAMRNDSYDWWEYFYNPGGKYLSSLYEMEPIYSRYFEIPFQLEARIRLIRLQLLIKNNKIEETNIREFLNRQPVNNQDPYLDEPVKYNVTEKILYIVPFSRDDQKVVIFL